MQGERGILDPPASERVGRSLRVLRTRLWRVPRRIWFGGGLVLVVCMLSPAVGCGVSHAVLEPYGKTFYLDGAGGWRFGRRDVPEGLRRAGYRGDCEVFEWSTTHIPLLDHIDPLGANKLWASSLARRIKAYKQKYPHNPVNLIALSAGTGVAVWALERLKGEYQVNNVVLVGSSLSHQYDMDQALLSVAGKVYIYHSPRDAILPLAWVIGTVDGRLGARVAGQVGLHLKESYGGKVVNIKWEKKWERLGWKGGHTDCVSRPFVQYEIADRLMIESRRRKSESAPSASAPGGGK